MRKIECYLCGKPYDPQDMVKFQIGYILTHICAFCYILLPKKSRTPAH